MTELEAENESLKDPETRRDENTNPQNTESDKNKDELVNKLQWIVFVSFL